MLLSNCNVQELVTEQVKAYLSDNELSFDELKAYITSKLPIPEIQTQCTKILSETKHSDFIKVKKALENQAYKKQLSDDEKQAKLDLIDEEKDDDQKKRLTKELGHIPSQLTSYETDCLLLKHKLVRLMSSASAQVHQHEQKLKSPKNTKKSSSLEERTLTIDRLNSSILQLEIKIQKLNDRSTTIEIKLQELEEREQDRKDRKSDRSNRNQARTGYQSTGEGLLETLSHKSENALTSSIKDQYKALETKYSDLIEDANAINFAFFMGLLPDHMNDLKLTVQEEEALRHLLKLMKQHLKYEQQAITFHDTLNKKRQSISSELLKLKDFNSQVKHLQNDNPNLTTSTKHLSTLNKELNATLERNIHLRKRLAMPGFLLLTLTFLSTIPLILTAYGVIPYFIAPIFLFLLVSAPPVLLLAATLAIGIAAIVFRVKQHTNESNIQVNAQTIQSNNNKMKRNSTNLHTIRDETIPALEVQIKKDETTRDNLIASLKEAQDAMAQTLKQAKEINPVSYSKSTLLSSPSPSPLRSSSTDIEEQEDEELSESDSAHA